MLTPTQPKGSWHPERRSYPHHPDQESSTQPCELRYCDSLSLTVTSVQMNNFRHNFLRHTFSCQTKVMRIEDSQHTNINLVKKKNIKRKGLVGTIGSYVHHIVMENFSRTKKGPWELKLNKVSSTVFGSCTFPCTKFALCTFVQACEFI